MRQEDHEDHKDINNQTCSSTMRAPETSWKDSEDFHRRVEKSACGGRCQQNVDKPVLASLDASRCKMVDTGSQA